MLSSIHIRDLAVVSSVELDLKSGMTALTGETGAGKSILIDALGLALGERADKGMIRNGCERAEITALFRLNDQPLLRNWLQEEALDEGDECILRRILVRDGSSRAYINGRPVNLKQLQQLGERLVDIHGQHAHQSLLQRSQQRELLDGYAHHPALLEELKEIHRQWQEARAELERLDTASAERLHRLDLLRFQIGELEGLNLAEGELEALDEELGRLSNAGQLTESSYRVLSLLVDDEDSALARANQGLRELQELCRMDHALDGCREMVENAAIQLKEMGSELRHYADRVEMDPQRQEQVEQRIGAIQDMARKYRCRPQQLMEQLEALQQELEQLQQADIQLEALEKRTRTLQQQYMAQAEALDGSRREAARRLAQQVTDSIRELGMPDGVFDIEVERLPDEKAGASGLNRVEFLVSANAGQSPQSLAKVASGGELSRISLAIQVATIEFAQVPTLIFDEVDVGIGGGVAEIVGRLLRRLGETRQILCVTHLPQVASQGHHHLQVSKERDQDGVSTRIRALDEEPRVEEIARMLGGIEITPQTLAHAREMITLSGACKH